MIFIKTTEQTTYYIILFYIFIPNFYNLMGQTKIKSALYRLITDLIKADNILAVDELDFLDRFCDNYEISEADKLSGYQMTLGDALSLLASLPTSDKDKMIKKMKVSTESDGDSCSMTESLLIQAAYSTFTQKGAHVISMPSRNLPVNRSQILYVENKESSTANVVLGKDETFKELSNIVRLGGFELIYIPKIAQHYAAYGNISDIERVITLVSPAHTKEQISNTIRILQHMSSRYFYQNILKGKLCMPLEIKKPVWMIRLIDNVVNGVDYANFLCIEVARDIKGQLSEFVEMVTSRMHEFTITINERKDSNRDFFYGGFYKSILDVMSIKEVDRWELRIRTYGDGTEQFRDPETGKKTTISIWKNDEEYPLLISGRDAAFYVLLLCASAAGEGGIDFNDMGTFRRIMSQYEKLYQKLSRRSIDGTSEHQRCPDVTAAQTRIPMKSRLITAIKSSRLTEQSLYMPQEQERGMLYIPVEPEKVKVITMRGMTSLEESELYQEYKSSATPQR